MATCTRCLRDASTGACADPLCPLALIPAVVQLPDTTIGRRLGASGLEYVAFLVAEILTGSLIGALSVVPVVGTLVGVVIGGVFSLLGAIYWTVKDTAGGRRSLGKRVGGMRVVDAATGKDASVAQAITRNSYFILACLIAIIPGVEVIGWALFAIAMAVDSALILGDGGGRRMGDRLAGTQVLPRRH
ncbi:MAG: hypothetical protein ACI8PZ_005784 [Myxococcota bacterium]